MSGFGRLMLGASCDSRKAIYSRHDNQWYSSDDTVQRNVIGPRDVRMNLRLHQLRALVGVVEHGGIRATARAQFISQAALTKALRELEADAGVALLVRSSRGVKLTDAGKRLYARAYLVSRQLELAVDELASAGAEQRGHVGVALSPYVIVKHLGQTFSWFRKRYPRVTIEVMEGLVSRALPRLRDGSVDMALVADTGELPGTEFQIKGGITVPQHIVVREGHPALANPSAKSFAELEWILLGPREGLKSSRLRSMFAQAEISPPSRILLCDTLSGLTLLRNSDVAGIVPAPLLAEPEGRGMIAVNIPKLEPGALRLSLMTRYDVPLSPAAEYFVECLFSACGAASSRLRP